MSTLRKENSITAPTADPLVEEGRRFYDEQLRDVLEAEHTGCFVAIEPFAGKYFLADTAIAALQSGRRALPDSLFFLVRVGHKAAHRIGGYGARIR